MNKKNVNKFIYLLWAPHNQKKNERRELLLKNCAQQLLGLGVEKLVMYIADDDSDVRSPAPKPFFEEMMCASVEIWIEDPGMHESLEKIITSAGFRCAAFRVDESIYREYGSNRFMHQRDWPDGRRSPGVVAVTLMKRPEKLSRDEWVRRWHGTMSPVSEKIQPRTRYVRNLVLEKLSPDAPDYEGIVIEAWPSKKHVSNYFLFYGADSIFQLIGNMFRILRAVKSFLRIRDIRTVMMSEYFIKTDF